MFLIRPTMASSSSINAHRAAMLPLMIARFAKLCNTPPDRLAQIEDFERWGKDAASQLVSPIEHSARFG